MSTTAETLAKIEAELAVDLFGRLSEAVLGGDGIDRVYDAAQSTVNDWEIIKYRAGSPIELMVGASFIQHGLRYVDVCETDWNIINGEFIPQYKIGPYRVDFFVGMDGFRFAIECDGHNFHERTKEQAKRDRSRDRDLQYFGYVVLRFTGSEIWENPDAVVQSCFEYVGEHRKARLDDFRRILEKVSQEDCQENSGESISESASGSNAQ